MASSPFTLPDGTGLYGSLSEVPEEERLGVVREYMTSMRRPFIGGQLILLMNTPWYQLVKFAFSQKHEGGPGLSGPYQQGDRVLGYDIYINELCPLPVLMPFKDYLARNRPRTDITADGNKR